jgi:hypothetical protein
MVEALLSFFGENLIEVMTSIMLVALTLRWVSYRHSKRDEGYFSNFTRELAATIDEDKVKSVEIKDVGFYLDDLLGRVNKRLPDRNLRKELSRDNRPSEQESASTKKGEAISLKEYVGSKHGLIANIQNESAVFKTSVPPNFTQLTDRVMSQDENWSKLWGVIPIDGVTRILDVLPTLFIVLGVFGTFIGISMALPEIANIDFSNLEASGETLSTFVVNVTFAMKTSIAGIFFSIVLTLLNTIFPVDASRELTFEKVENVLQALWYHLQTDNSNRTVENELKTIRGIFQELWDEHNNKSKKKSA